MGLLLVSGDMCHPALCQGGGEGLEEQACVGDGDDHHEDCPAALF